MCEAKVRKRRLPVLKPVREGWKGKGEARRGKVRQDDERLLSLLITMACLIRENTKLILKPNFYVQASSFDSTKIITTNRTKLLKESSNIVNRNRSTLPLTTWSRFPHAHRHILIASPRLQNYAQHFDLGYFLLFEFPPSSNFLKQFASLHTASRRLVSIELRSSNFHVSLYAL